MIRSRCDTHVHIVGPIERYPQVSTRTYQAGPASLDELNLYSAVVARQIGQFDHAFRTMANGARPLGWHVEIIATPMVLAQSATTISSAGVPLVIDHYGPHGAAEPESPEGQRLLELFALSHVWVKLSPPYRVGNDPMNTRPNQAWLAAIFGIAADQCNWGSDWPHTPYTPAWRAPRCRTRSALSVTVLWAVG
jgi:predicted TIM-barrel fold metal-dependent hydrolase